MKSLIFVLMLFNCMSTALAFTKGKVYKLTILHTNDHHGRFWPNKEGELGLAARATLINRLREEVKKDGGNVLLLDAGDVNTGVPQSDLLDAEPDFRGMAALGYDVMALGNHEFDQPLVNILKQQKEWAKFPFISANIYNKKNMKRIFPSHISKTFGDLKVTVFGLTTEDTPFKSKAAHSKGLYFKPVIEEAKTLVPPLRKKCDILIGLTHMGHYPDEKNGADAPGDVTLARKVNGIDVIVGGHTQKPLFDPDIQNGTIIVQAYEWGKYVGKVDLEFLDGKVTLKSSKLIPVNLKDSKEKISQDPVMENFLKPFKAKGDAGVTTVIGNADQEFIGKRDVVRSMETNLGNLVTTAYKDKLKADLGLSNSGGIRDSIYPGKITIESVLMVLPFEGEIVKAEFTGQELKNYFETILKDLTPGSGGFPQIRGANVTYDKTTRKIKSLKINGKDLSLTQKYFVALPEFLANGGDKYPVIQYRKFGYVDAEVLKDFISEKKNLKAADYAPTGYLKAE